MSELDKSLWQDEAFLVMVSGGVDSTYVLWELLEFTEFPVHAHHISLRVQGEYRHDCEDLAFQRVTDWLRENTRSFTQSTSTIEYAQLPYRGWDTDTQLLMGARVAANLSAHRVTVALGITADDNHKPIIQKRLERKVIPTLWAALINSIDPQLACKIDPEIRLPVGDMYKPEIVDAMPEELLDLTWSCRAPDRRNGLIKPCGRCEPCLALKSIREERAAQ